jgi:hypothetical protein
MLQEGEDPTSYRFGLRAVCSGGRIPGSRREDQICRGRQGDLKWRPFLPSLV